MQIYVVIVRCAAYPRQPRPLFFLRDVNFFPFDFFDQPSFFSKRIEQTVSFLSDLAMGAAHCVYAACAISELEGSTTTALKLRKIYRKNKTITE